MHNLPSVFLILLLLLNSSISKADEARKELVFNKSIDRNLNMKSKPETIIADEKIIKRFSIPEKASLYRSIEGLTLVSSQDEFNKYLQFDTTNIKYDDEYRKKSSYKKVMKLIDNLKIDFDNFYLLLVTRTETSGSIKVSVSDPIWSNEETIKLKVNSKSPLGINHTNDMAYYGYAYKINKSVKYVKINNNKINLSDGIPESKLSEEERALNILMGGFGY